MSSENERDLEWIRAILRGRGAESAFEQLHTAYRPRVEGFFRGKRFSSAEVPELAQDVFLLAFKHLSTFKGKSSFRSWLFAIASHHCRDRWKSAGRAKRTGRELSLNEQAEGIERSIPSENPGPDRLFFERERVAKLEAAIETLPDRMRECVRLRLQDYDLQQIATLLGIKIGTVKAQLHKARQRLAAALGDDRSLWEASS